LFSFFSFFSFPSPLSLFFPSPFPPPPPPLHAACALSPFLARILHLATQFAHPLALALARPIAYRPGVQQRQLSRAAEPATRAVSEVPAHQLLQQGLPKTGVESWAQQCMWARDIGRKGKRNVSGTEGDHDGAHGRAEQDYGQITRAI